MQQIIQHDSKSQIRKHLVWYISDGVGIATCLIRSFTFDSSPDANWIKWNLDSSIIRHLCIIHHTNHYDHTEYHCHTDQLIIPSHEYDDHNYHLNLPGYFCRHDHLDHHHDQYHTIWVYFIFMMMVMWLYRPWRLWSRLSWSLSSWPWSYDLGNHNNHSQVIIPAHEGQLAALQFSPSGLLWRQNINRKPVKKDQSKIWSVEKNIKIHFRSQNCDCQWKGDSHQVKHLWSLSMGVHGDTGWFISLVPPNFSTKMKTAKQPITAQDLLEQQLWLADLRFSFWYWNCYS